MREKFQFYETTIFNILMEILHHIPIKHKLNSDKYSKNKLKIFIINNNKKIR